MWAVRHGCVLWDMSLVEVNERESMFECDYLLSQAREVQGAGLCGRCADSMVRSHL